MKNKVVLAFSGGLDTSFCVKYLIHEKGLEVHSAIVNTGGFSKDELQEIEKRAYDLGVTSHTSIDAEEIYYDKCVKYMIFGNVLKNNTYPLSVSSERMFQALEILKHAKKVGATHVAHGSTGAGNDQVRFDLVFQVLAPEVQIITPIRELKLSRKEEIEYLAKHGVIVDWKKAQYSINKGLWGTSVGGKETLTSHQSLPEEAYPSQLTKNGEETLTISYLKGEISAVNGIAMTKANAIRQIEALAAPYAIGRDTHVGDTIIGIKGRVGFEAAASLIIIKSHHLLEKHILTKWQQYWKEQLGNWYGMLLHEGQYLEPVMRNIETFLLDSQDNVTGDVFIKLRPYRFELIGIESKFDMMKSQFGEYGEMNKGWSGEDVQGFTKIISNSMKIHAFLNETDI